MATELTYTNKNKLSSYFRNRRFYHNKKYLGSIIGFFVVLIALSTVAYLYPEDVNQFASDVAVGLGLKDNSVATTRTSGGGNSGGFTEAVTVENLPSFLESTEFVNDLPKGGKINLFVGENSYKLTKGTVESGSYDDADVTINVPESYLANMGSDGLCETFSTAWNNGEIGFETSLSQLQLGWKYKGMMKHRDCLNV